LGLNSKKEEFGAVDKYIVNKLKPIHQTHYENLNKFFKLRDEKAPV